MSFLGHIILVDAFLQRVKMTVENNNKKFSFFNKSVC